MPSTLELLEAAVRSHVEVLTSLLKDSAFVRKMDAAAGLLEDCLRSDGTVFAAGNGGSAAAASHLAAELVGRFRRDRSGLRAVSLASDAAILTALGNDFPPAELFSRQLKALARPGDLLVCLTTSGRSPNVIAAIDAAIAMGLGTITLCGSDVSRVSRSDEILSVPSGDVARTQEVQELLLHVLCERIENELLGRD